MKHFLIYTNKHKDQELATTKRIQNYLGTKGCTVKLKVKESDWKEEADSMAAAGQPRVWRHTTVSAHAWRSRRGRLLYR